MANNDSLSLDTFLLVRDCNKFIFHSTTLPPKWITKNRISSSTLISNNYTRTRQINKPINRICSSPSYRFFRQIIWVPLKNSCSNRTSLKTLIKVRNSCNQALRQRTNPNRSSSKSKLQIYRISLLSMTFLFWAITIHQFHVSFFKLQKADKMACTLIISIK